MATVTYLQSTNSTSDLTTYTFSTQNLGTAASDRYIIVNAATSVSSGAGSISSVTVQGISATSVVSKTQAANTANVNTLWIVAVPTGTTGNVVVTAGSAAVRCGIALWSATGLGSATAYDTAVDDTVLGVNPSASTTIDCEANGFIVSSSMIGNNATTSGCAWTGLTERYEQTVESNATISGGSDDFATIQTGLTVTSAWTNNNVNAEAALVVASWSGSAGSSTNSGFLAFM
jgi:hypothetical protein